MNKKVVLTVDDEIHILELLKYNLEEAGYEIIQAETGESAVDILKKNKVDLVLLDQMLPGIDGLEVLRRIRADLNLNKIHVIMLTAKGEEFDKVLGLEMGADDYISKPFGIRELLARVKAMLRRDSNISSTIKNNTIIFDDLKINTENRTVFKCGKLIEMSLKEFELLKLLCENPGRVYSRDVLLEKVWGYEYIGETRTVDVHIRNIRKKIEEDDSNPVYIKTVRGYGYKFREE